MKSNLILNFEVIFLFNTLGLFYLSAIINTNKIVILTIFDKIDNAFSPETTVFKFS